MSKVQVENETSPEAFVALLVVFLLIVVFVQQSGLLAGLEGRSDVRAPQAGEMQSQVRETSWFPSRISTR